MSETEKLRAGLHSLVLFRGLLNDRVVQKFDALLAQPAWDGVAALDAYGAFVSELFRHTDNWSDYLLRAAVEDENLYILRVCSGHAPEAPLQQSLARELAVLGQLAAFSGSAIRSALCAEMPAWDTRALDFASVYARHLRELPQKGYGVFAKYHVFTVHDGRLVPVKHPDPQKLEELSGYERERGKVIANTRALLEGRPASNVLLYGDAGTGKSSTVKAVANAFAADGLRLIEVKKNQLYQIPDLVEMLARNPLKFILFIDDLSFSANDDDFAALKAILEGSVSSRSSNLAVYATSNRRHLVKETFSDRDGDEIHLSDTMQELMSLSARFGLTITFSRPDKELYCHIVENLALLYGIEMPRDQLMTKAEAHAIRSGGRSPRTAKQFIEQLKAQI